MQHIQIDLVTQLSDQELQEVTSAAHLAYLGADSPAANILTGGKPELLSDLFRGMTECCLIDGFCYVAKDASTQTMVGSALWFPPGKALWSTDESREKTGFNEFFGRLDEATKEWWSNEYDPQVNRFLAEYYGRETSTESWWLNSISVLPSYQGKGIGTSLFNEVLKKATADEAIGCCTDTAKNVKFYRSLNMEVVGTFNVCHPVDGRENTIWGLKRYGARAQA